jgi:hypothetical protein
MGGRAGGADVSPATPRAYKARCLDPFACYLLLTFGLSLAVALATTDPELILARNTPVNGTGGLLVAATVLIGRKLGARREQRSPSQG